MAQIVLLWISLVLDIASKASLGIQLYHMSTHHHYWWAGFIGLFIAMSSLVNAGASLALSRQLCQSAAMCTCSGPSSWQS